MIIRLYFTPYYVYDPLIPLTCVPACEPAWDSRTRLRSRFCSLRCYRDSLISSSNLSSASVSLGMTCPLTSSKISFFKLSGM